MIQFLFGVVSLLGGAASIYQGAKKESTEAAYNAEIKAKQQQMIESQKRIVSGQWSRDIGRAQGTLVSRVAGSGITMSGSPWTALLDLTTQMETDKAIQLHNLSWEKEGVRSEEAAYRRESKYAIQRGYANTFTNLLSTGYNLYGRR